MITSVCSCVTGFKKTSFYDTSLFLCVHYTATKTKTTKVYLVCTVTTESPKTKQKKPYSQVHIPLVWVLLFYCRALYWRSVTLLLGL